MRACGFALVFILLLAACRPVQPESVPGAAQSPAGLRMEAAATGVYVILPESYALRLDEGLLLASSGALEDLPVYPTREEAERALQAFEARGEAFRAWKVFRLEADWNKDLVMPDGEYRLSRPAKLAADAR
jgi:hypothetical protein